MEQRLFTKNFTLLVLGQASSLFGNYILRLALSMYVLEMTGSAAVFAGILSIATIPTILYSGKYRRGASYGEVKIRQIIVCACGNRCLYHSGRGCISFPVRRDDPICCDCCCLLRYAGRD